MYYQTVHANSILTHSSPSYRPLPLFRKVGSKSHNRDARREPLEVNGKIHAGQSLIEIIDVEHDVLFGGRKGAEVHQVAVPAGLDRYACGRLLPKILSHHGGGTAQEGERVCRHTFVTNGY